VIRRIDLYILKFFFLSLLVVFLAIGLTIIVINAVEEMHDFIDHDVPMVEILEYYVYFSGWVLKSFMPMFVLLATLFSVSIMARNNELLAMKACGLSLYRITLPIFLAVMVLSAGHFYYNEYIFPPANEKRLEIKKFTIDRRSRRGHTRVKNVSRQVSPGHYYSLQVYDAARREGTQFRSVRYTENRLERVIIAERMIYNDHRWHAIDGVERLFDSAAIESYNEFDTLPLPEIAELPRDLERRIGKPEDMGYDELKNYIDVMKRTGGPYAREAVDLRAKIAFPISSCIVVLLCIPFASNPRRGGIAVSFAAGALVSLSYFVLFRTLQSAGYSEKIPMELAVWGVNGLFLLIGVVSMIKARK
jgi:lipopolysaccharide export system permease protein